jgi:four helix bundle protein
LKEVKNNILKDKSFQFSLVIISVYKKLSIEQREFILSKQFLRSGTAIGALYREAEHAESKPDFIHKLSISLKEANETKYWIDLLYQSDYLNQSDFDTLNLACTELIRLLVAIIKTSKAK